MQGKTDCLPGSIEFVEVVAILVPSELLLGEERTERTLALQAQRVEGTHRHEAIDVLILKVSARRPPIESCGDRWCENG